MKSEDLSVHKLRRLVPCNLSFAHALALKIKLLTSNLPYYGLCALYINSVVEPGMEEFIPWKGL